MVHELTLPFRKDIRNVILAKPGEVIDGQTVSHPFPGTPAAPAAAQQPPPANKPREEPKPKPETGPSPESLLKEENRRLRDEFAQLKTLLANFEEGFYTLKEQQQQRLEEMQIVAVELALAAASQLIQAEIDADNLGVAQMVQKLLDQLNPDQSIKVSLHPVDLALMKRHLGDGKPLFQNGQPVQLVEDPSLARGDCRAESGEVFLLSRLQDQLDDLRGRLLNTLPDAQVERRKPLPDRQKLGRFPDRRETA